jgi:hypothetical protein
MNASQCQAAPQRLQEKEGVPATIGDDLLRGADEIAKFVFGSEQHRRKVYYLTGDARVRMPHFKIGSVLCARKSTLLAWIEKQEARS